MKITFDPIKRDAAPKDRGIDVRDASKIFEGRHTSAEDDRFGHGENPPDLGGLSGKPNGRGGLDAA